VLRSAQQVATAGSSGSYNFEAGLTERPTRRFLLSILRPFLVCIRALKPPFRNLFILLLRGFSTKNSPARKIKSFLLNYAVFLNATYKLLAHYYSYLPLLQDVRTQWQSDSFDKFISS